MSLDTTEVRAKLRKALDNIGRTNGHACPTSSSNVDPILHELFIAGEATSYWRTRYDAAKADAMNLCVADLDEAVSSVIKLNAGTSVSLCDGNLYHLSAEIKRPAKRLDQRALRNYMIVHMKLDKAAVDAAFAACSTKNGPAKTLRVSGK